MYNVAKKVCDINKAIVNRFVVDLYHDNAIKVLLEAPSMMGIRMAMNTGDKSDYHVVNVEELPDMQTSFSLTRHQGTLLSILKSGVLPKCHVFYADYCGAPIKTSGPIHKDPAAEAKMIYNHLLPRGVGIFTFCRRGCQSAEKVAEKILAPYFKMAYVHKYSNMMVFIGVKRTASDKVVSEIRYQFQAILGKYYNRSGHFISAEEMALVRVHQNKAMKCISQQDPEECDVCLNWFNDQDFFINTSASSSKDATVCICKDCWEDAMPSDSYELKDGKCVWKDEPVALLANKYRKFQKHWKLVRSKIDNREAKHQSETKKLEMKLKRQELMLKKMSKISKEKRKAVVRRTRSRLQTPALTTPSRKLSAGDTIYKGQPLFPSLADSLVSYDQGTIHYINNNSVIVVYTKYDDGVGKKDFVCFTDDGQSKNVGTINVGFEFIVPGFELEAFISDSGGDVDSSGEELEEESESGEELYISSESEEDAATPPRISKKKGKKQIPQKATNNQQQSMDDWYKACCKFNIRCFSLFDTFLTIFVFSFSRYDNTLGRGNKYWPRKVQRCTKRP
jgi:hypothetical protein